MDSRESGNDGVGMRRANSSFRRKAECRRWETRMPRLCETGSFRWFLDMNLMERSFDPTVFTKNRRRLLEHRIG